MRLRLVVLMLGWLIIQAGMPGVVLAEDRTLQGEIVDPGLYLKEARHGAGMEADTYEAADGGQTLALLDTGTDTLYLLVAEEPGENPNELVYDYVNQTVRVSGEVLERGGLRGIVVKSVEPLTPPAPDSEGPPSAPGTAGAN